MRSHNVAVGCETDGRRLGHQFYVECQGQRASHADRQLCDKARASLVQGRPMKAGRGLHARRTLSSKVIMRRRKIRVRNGLEVKAVVWSYYVFRGADLFEPLFERVGVSIIRRRPEKGLS